MPMLATITQAFETRFGGRPSLVVRAPGRVNLIGEHTDYNEGFVLPMAIDRAVWIALRPRPGPRVRAWSVAYEELSVFSLNALQPSDAGWAEYLKGVAWALQTAGVRLAGWEGVVAGDVPVGAGLASSAALEMATARAFAAVAGLPWEPRTMARIGQRAENAWVGVQCGIMDQLIAAAGQAGHALLIDCRTLETQAVPLPPGAAVVVLDTATRRGLVGSAYNQRRAQCRAAAEAFGVSALRDLPPEQVAADRPPPGLDEVTYRRARHVVGENARTLQAAEAMRRGDAAALGRLMDASHASLRDDFAVSSSELDAMVACARADKACYGARLTGAGFGGCAVALVREDTARTFARRAAACYAEATGRAPQVTVCTASAGAEVVRDARAGPGDPETDLPPPQA
jgi:galactokinase